MVYELVMALIPIRDPHHPRNFVSARYPGAYRMILGRDPNQFLGAIVAIINMLVVLGAWALTTPQIAAIDTAAGAIILIVAGNVTNHAAIAASKS